MISHVVFDFDGTLADSLELVVGLYNDIAQKRGYGLLTPQGFAELRTLSIRQRRERLGVPFYRVPGLVVEVGRRYLQVAGSVSLYRGVPELLRALRAGGRQVAIVSTNREENIRAILERHGLSDLVGAVHCSSKLFGKARLLRKLMYRARLRPEQVVYVGDELRDVEASREAGVRVISVTWGVDGEQQLREAAPDALAVRPEEIADLVQRWAAPSRPA